MHESGVIAVQPFCRMVRAWSSLQRSRDAGWQWRRAAARILDRPRADNRVENSHLPLFSRKEYTLQPSAALHFSDGRENNCIRLLCVHSENSILNNQLTSNNYFPWNIKICIDIQLTHGLNNTRVS